MKSLGKPRLVLAVTLASTLLAGTAIAAPQDAPAGPRMQPPATLQEATARADKQFARLDADRDGQVTQAEMDAARQQRMERREARGKTMGKRGGRMAKRMFARLDSDRNGSISQAEFRAGATQRFQRIDTNGDGRVDTTEAQAMRDKRMQHRAKRGGEQAPTPPTGN
ncbi:EF-hand domain-containing protein [Sphingomonas sp.]|uniref:EF-hand domain-containing protein n=1 Tax=Sphingomonas sp. TaxID=28214 RepID=UPI002C50B61A|nr:EF-hand domain-containing protein [Sphingomonas sp.]HTG39738.1 EF-hand domain-containing protein [Sphingomonas sp.]